MNVEVENTAGSELAVPKSVVALLSNSESGVSWIRGAARGRHVLSLVALTLLLASAGPALAQDEDATTLRISEAQAVERALDQPDRNRAWNAEVTQSRAAALQERAWPNPSLSYSHEQSYEDPDAVGEDFVLMAQRLPLSGQRRLDSRAARKLADARRHETTARMAELAAEVRGAYYRVLYLKRRVEVREAGLVRLRALEDTLAERVETGESAPYDLERFRADVAKDVADLEVEKANLAKSKSRLRGMLRVSERDGALVPTSELLPGEIPDDEALMTAVQQRPEVAAAQSRIEAARLSETSAKRSWVPEPTVTAGYRGASVAGEHFPGFVAGLSLTLPIFDQAAGRRLAAQASVARARARRDIVLQRFRAHVEGLAEQTRRMRDAAKGYFADGVERSERAVEVAKTAYDADKKGFPALIEAHRSYVGARLEYLDYAYEARSREVELRKNLGQPDLGAIDPPE